MQRTRCYRLLIVAALVAPVASGAQTPNPPAPRAAVRQLVTIDGYLDGFVRLPSGRIVIYAVHDSTFAYDVGSKRRTLLGLDMVPGSVSPRGDRLAFSRTSEDRHGLRLWTMPIDPVTGAATGHAQIVSQRRTDHALRPRFSPDGQTLAFLGASARLPEVWDLTVVPVTGGPERVIASYQGSRSFAWSADGQSLDVATTNDTTSIERVAVDGGAHRTLFPLTPLTRRMPVGVSPDAGIAIFTGNPDAFHYRTATGAEGQIEVSLPALDDAWGYDFTLDARGRYLTATFRNDSQRVRILDAETGRTRVVMPDETARLPAWSADGRRLAVLAGSVSHYDIAVMNRDGSGVRRYPLSLIAGHWISSVEAWSMPWSPDGRFLALYAQDSGVVGWMGGRQRHLVVLDLSSGATRILATAPNGFLGAFRWRSDSKAIRLIRDPVVAAGIPNRRAIIEVALDGTERVLRALSAEFPRMSGATLGADGEAVIAVGTGQAIERFLVPLNGGAARKLPHPGTESGITSTSVGGLSMDNRVVLPIGDGSGAFPVLRVVSTVGDSMRTVRAPFGSVNGNVLPDGKRAVVTGKAPGDSLHKLYFVSLEDGSQRLLGEIPGGSAGGRLAPSPDGKLVAFTVDGPFTTTLHEIDFGPALRVILRR
jgi:Tol biopolymer transport system component